MPKETNRRRSVRGIALGLLNAWQESGDHAETFIRRASTREQLAPRDRGFLNALVLGVLRNGSLLDFWIDELRDGKVDDETQMILRLGLCQLLVLDVDEHAAVNETVSLSRRARGFINAILRRAIRERAALLAKAEDLPPDGRYSLPGFLIERWKDRFGSEAASALAAWTNHPAPTTVRANGLIDGAREEIAALPGAEPLENFDGFFRVDPLPLAELGAGLCYAQDPSTSLAPILLDPRPGDSVLDACAAPGGKSAILAQRMENRGRLVCADSLDVRLETLQENVTRLGVSIAEPLLIDWLRDDLPGEKFDRILIDVPCSNTGVLRRRVDVRWRLEEDVFESMQRIQLDIAKRVLHLLKPGGTLVYSTCSIEREENEDVVARLVAAVPGLTLEAEQRTLPHLDGVDGSYCARLRLAESEA